MLRAIGAALLLAALATFPGTVHGGTVVCSLTAAPETAADVQVDRAEGVVRAIASSIRSEPGQPETAPALSLALETSDGRLFVTLTADARVEDADGQPIPATSIPLGARVRVEGRRLGATSFEATAVRVLP